MGDAEAGAWLTRLQEAMEPEAWARIIAGYQDPQIIHQRVPDRSGVCERCGATVYVGFEEDHQSWHRQITTSIQAIAHFCLKAPHALAELLAMMLEDEAAQREGIATPGPQE